MDDYKIPGQTTAEQIALLRAAAVKCRRLATATGDVELMETLGNMADEYEARIEAVINSKAAPESL